MLSCRDVHDLASAHIDRELPWRRRMAVRLHLAMCKHCRRLMRQLRATVAVLGRVKDADPPVSPEREAALVELFKRERP